MRHFTLSEGAPPRVMAGLEEHDFEDDLLKAILRDSDDDIFFPESPDVLAQIAARHKRLRLSRPARDVHASAIWRASRGGALRARRTQGVRRKARFKDVPDPNTGLPRTGRAMWERGYRGSAWWRDYLNVFHPA